MFVLRCHGRHLLLILFLKKLLLVKFSLGNMANNVVIAASVKQTATIIFLHGLGDTGHGWASAIQAIRAPYVKVICPTAPTQPVTLNAGFRMPSWFDLRSLDIAGPEDEDGIKQAAEGIRKIIEDEIKAGVPSSRILLGGFSQGGGLALYTGLTHPQKLGGIMALSCWLPIHKSFPAACRGDNQQTPIVQCHGDCDPIVSYKWGQMTSKIVKEFAPKYEFKSYRNLMHGSSDEEMQDLKLFIEKALPPV